MQLRIRETGNVVDSNSLKTIFPNVSFPENLTEELLNEFGIDFVFEGAQPSTENKFQYVHQDGVEQINGKWFTKFTLGPTFVEYTDKDKVVHTVEEQKKSYNDRITNEKSKLIRFKRDIMLQKTDWRFRSDLTPSQEWVDYCQALRDIPLQEGFPFEVNWPSEPKNKI